MLRPITIVASLLFFASSAHAVTETEAIQKLEEINSMREKLASTLSDRTEPITSETFQQVCVPVGKALRGWAESQGVRARQLSHKARNPDHQIQGGLEARISKEFQADPSRKVLVLDESLGEQRQVHVIRRILVEKQCLHCHGAKEKRPEFIVKKYPKDRAFGFSEGDLRGLYWVSWQASPSPPPQAQ